MVVAQQVGGARRYAERLRRDNALRLFPRFA
jgi:hypothetical protein